MTLTRIFSLSCLLLATACTGTTVREMVGVDSRAPDEFRVVSRPPLSVPPQFNLRPPAIGDGSTPYATDKKAEALITGNASQAPQSGQTFTLKSGNSETAIEPVMQSPVSGMAGSSAESQFLLNAGANRADPTVRQTLVEEKYVRQEEKQEEGWWEIWPDDEETTVNPGKESERIQKNQDEGKPINEGEVPVIDPKDKGVLGRILDF